MLVLWVISTRNYAFMVSEYCTFGWPDRFMLLFVVNVNLTKALQQNLVKYFLLEAIDTVPGNLCVPNIHSYSSWYLKQPLLIHTHTI